MGKRSVEKRLADLEGGPRDAVDGGEIYVATITPDGEHEEWLPPEAYRESYGELPDSEFIFIVNGGHVDG